MAKLIYSMNPSLDGFISGPDGNLDWSAPDEELHRFHNERTRALGGCLLGRRLYETMVYWETAHEDPAVTDYTREFADIWQALPKVVFSKTLTEVVGNTRLARGGIAEEATGLMERTGKDIAIGGAELAGSSSRATLPALSGIRLTQKSGGLEVAATDLELTIAATVIAEAHLRTLTTRRVTAPQLRDQTKENLIPTTSTFVEPGQFRGDPIALGRQAT